LEENVKFSKNQMKNWPSATSFCGGSGKKMLKNSTLVVEIFYSQLCKILGLDQIFLKPSA
jgi:hypothetical protein